MGADGAHFTPGYSVSEKSPRIELGTSRSEGHALTDCATHQFPIHQIIITFSEILR